MKEYPELNDHGNDKLIEYFAVHYYIIPILFLGLAGIVVSLKEAVVSQLPFRAEELTT